MIDHCISAHFKREAEDAYRMYVTDSLRLLLAHRPAKIDMIPRYVEIIDHEKTTEPEKTGDEIVLETVHKCGLRVV